MDWWLWVLVIITLVVVAFGLWRRSGRNLERPAPQGHRAVGEQFKDIPQTW